MKNSSRWSRLRIKAVKVQSRNQWFLRLTLSILTSLITTCLVIVIAFLVRHLPIPKELAGLTALAVIIGGIATFGGIVTGLFGLYSLTTVKDKIDDAIDVAVGELKIQWTHDTENLLHNYILAFSFYNQGLQERDLQTSENLMIEALRYAPNIPLAAQWMGLKLSEATIRWAWNVVGYQDPNPSFGAAPTDAVSDHVSMGDYRGQSAKWLEQAMTAAVPRDDIYSLLQPTFRI